MSFQDRLSINAGQKFCRKHSVILSIFIKLPFVFVLSIFEWPLKTGFTVLYLSDTYKLYPPLILCILETPKGVLSQTVKTKMKCRKRVCGISPGSALFANIKTNLHSSENSSLTPKTQNGSSHTYCIRQTDRQIFYSLRSFT